MGPTDVPTRPRDTRPEWTTEKKAVEMRYVIMKLAYAKWTFKRIPTNRGQMQRVVDLTHFLTFYIYQDKVILSFH